MTWQALTRRGFVQRLGFAVAAAGGAGLVSGPKALAAGSLTPARQATYGAIYTTLRTANGISVAPSDVSAAVSAFKGDYTTRDPRMRTYIDNVLDSIESATTPGFSRSSSSARAALLHAWRNAPCLPGERGASDETHRRRAYAVAAIELGSFPTAVASDYRLEPLPI